MRTLGNNALPTPSSSKQSTGSRTQLTVPYNALGNQIQTPQGSPQELLEAYDLGTKGDPNALNALANRQIQTGKLFESALNNWGKRLEAIQQSEWERSLSLYKTYLNTNQHKIQREILAEGELKQLSPSQVSKNYIRRMKQLKLDGYEYLNKHPTGQSRDVIDQLFTTITNNLTEKNFMPKLEKYNLDDITKTLEVISTPLLENIEYASSTLDLSTIIENVNELDQLLTNPQFLMILGGREKAEQELAEGIQKAVESGLNVFVNTNPQEVQQAVTDENNVIFQMLNPIQRETLNQKAQQKINTINTEMEKLQDEKREQYVDNIKLNILLQPEDWNETQLSLLELPDGEKGDLIRFYRTHKEKNKTANQTQRKRIQTKKDFMNGGLYGEKLSDAEDDAVYEKIFLDIPQQIAENNDNKPIMLRSTDEQVQQDIQYEQIKLMKTQGVIPKKYFNQLRSGLFSDDVNIRAEARAKLENLNTNMPEIFSIVDDDAEVSALLDQINTYGDDPRVLIQENAKREQMFASTDYQQVSKQVDAELRADETDRNNFWKRLEKALDPNSTMDEIPALTQARYLALYKKYRTQYGKTQAERLALKQINLQSYVTEENSVKTVMPKINVGQGDPTIPQIFYPDVLEKEELQDKMRMLHKDAVFLIKYQNKDRSWWRGKKDFKEAVPAGRIYKHKKVKELSYNLEYITQPGFSFDDDIHEITQTIAYKDIATVGVDKQLRIVSVPMVLVQVTDTSVADADQTIMEFTYTPYEELSYRERWGYQTTPQKIQSVKNRRSTNGRTIKR